MLCRSQAYNSLSVRSTRRLLYLLRTACTIAGRLRSPTNEGIPPDHTPVPRSSEGIRSPERPLTGHLGAWGSQRLSGTTQPRQASQPDQEDPQLAGRTGFAWSPGPGNGWMNGTRLLHSRRAVRVLTAPQQGMHCITVSDDRLVCGAGALPLVSVAVQCDSHVAVHEPVTPIHPRRATKHQNQRAAEDRHHTTGTP